jgi:hypothetical protein
MRRKRPEWVSSDKNWRNRRRGSRRMSRGRKRISTER